jgi:diaminopimelate epimerase
MVINIDGKRWIIQDHGKECDQVINYNLIPCQASIGYDIYNSDGVYLETCSNLDVAWSKYDSERA